MTTKIEITHTFQAPRDLVFQAFSQSEQLKNWWGPKGWDFHISTFEFRKGGVCHYNQISPDGDSMWVTFIYEEIEVPKKLVYTYFFSDAEGNVVRAPFHDSWPLKMQNTFTFTEHDSKTTLTMIGIPISATEEEIKTFNDSQAMMQEGFSGTFYQLEDYLSKGSH
jgi:uncharacterized protein YndB with AHSA1/START domain